MSVPHDPVHEAAMKAKRDKEHADRIRIDLLVDEAVKDYLRRNADRMGFATETTLYVARNGQYGKDEVLARIEDLEDENQPLYEFMYPEKADQILIVEAEHLIVRYVRESGISKVDFCVFSMKCTPTWRIEEKESAVFWLRGKKP